MKRDKKVKDGELRWRKLGGGASYLKINGKVKIIKPGQVFSAKPEDIPEAFRDIIRPVEPGALQEVQNKDTKKKKPATYKLVHKGSGKYIVEDADGKQMNEGTLAKEDAQELIDTLT